MPNPDVSQISSAFNQFGGEVMRKKVIEWALRSQGVQVRTNVTAPQAMPKLSAVGGPRPYRSQDDTSGNGVKYTDRILTAYNSKWDSDFDPEEFRNTYLAAGVTDQSFAQAAVDQMAKEYLATILTTVLWLGVRNGSGTTAADICNGWGTIIAADIASTAIPANQVISTGAITNTNAVDSIETLARSVSQWMRDNGFIIYCPYHIFDKYTQNYRQLNGFLFNPSATGDYKLDNINAILRPVSWIPASSGRVVATVANNLVFGTDMESIRNAASVRRNIVENRQMMSAGCQYADVDVLYVNDQA